MATNPSVKKIRKGDLVKVRTGIHKNKTGKVLQVLPKEQAVLVEGIGMVKRHIHPNQFNPRGGTKDVHVPFPLGKISLVVDGKDKTSRVGLKPGKDGLKTRVARALNNKEIK